MGRFVLAGLLINTCMIHKAQSTNQSNTYLFPFVTFHGKVVLLRLGGGMLIHIPTLLQATNVLKNLPLSSPFLLSNTLL